MKFRAVLFDFDGVLVDTEWEIYLAWQRLFHSEGQELPLEIYERCVGSDFRTWSPKELLAELTGKRYDWERLDAERQGEIRAALAKAGPMPGVGTLLPALRASGHGLAVVSSSGHEWVGGWLRRLDLNRWFDTVVCREDAPRIKPEPDLWLEALRRLDLPAADCLAIEDSANGVKSAKAAGLHVWAVPNRTTAGSDFSAADAILPSVEEASQRLRGHAWEVHENG